MGGVLESVENVIILGKLIGLLFLFCLPLLSILFLKTKRNDLARPVMGTIFLVVRQCYEGFYSISNPEGPAVEFERSEDTTRDLRGFKYRRI